MQNTLLQSLLAHRSIRKWKNQLLSTEHLELLLQSAVRAPSASNLQH